MDAPSRRQDAGQMALVIPALAIPDFAPNLAPRTTIVAVEKLASKVDVASSVHLTPNARQASCAEPEAALPDANPILTALWNKPALTDSVKILVRPVLVDEVRNAAFRITELSVSAQADIPAIHRSDARRMNANGTRTVTWTSVVRTTAVSFPVWNLTLAELMQCAGPSPIRPSACAHPDTTETLNWNVNWTLMNA